MSKINRTRKAHLCDICGLEIPKGDPAEYMEVRYPTYKNVDGMEEGKQIGIGYYKGWAHADPEVCKTELNRKENERVNNLTTFENAENCSL